MKRNTCIESLSSLERAFKEILVLKSLLYEILYTVHVIHHVHVHGSYMYMYIPHLIILSS